MTSLAAWRSALIGRANAAWRGPLFSVAMSRPWRAILVASAVVAASLVATGASDWWMAFLQSYGVPALAFALASGSVRGDQSRERWTTLFQRGGAVSHHYRRQFAASLAILTLWIGAHLLLAAAVRPGPSDAALRGFAVGALLLGYASFATGVVSSSLLRRGDLAASIVALMLPVTLPILLRDSDQARAVRVVLEAFLPPLNAIFGLQGAAATGSWERWRPEWTAHLVVFACLCVSVVEWRLRRLERDDVTPARAASSG